ncbi:MAG: hypothetical protein QM770_13175 [Tepidisphaeraceae bacterium]
MSLRFEIYREGRRLEGFQPVAPMCIAQESIPVPGELAFKDGLLRSGPIEQATGASLLWDCGPAGEFALETTRLMPRGNKSMVLNVELARFRLMKLLQKVEDWGLSDVPAAAGVVAKLKELQERFAEALVAMPDGSPASQVADEVIRASIPLGDELALFNADQLLQRRKQQNAFARFVFGCRTDWTARNQRVKDLMADHFDYAVLPLTWKLLQPKEDTFDTAALDEWVEFLTRRRIPIIAGPIIDMSEGALPEWVYIWENDLDVLRDLMVDFVRKMVTRYRRAVSVWNVVGGLHSSPIGGISFEQTIELTRLLVAQVKSMLPQGRTLVTIRDPFSEQHSQKHPGVPPMLYADTIAQAGVSVDGFALEYEMGVPKIGSYTRDLFQLSVALDRLSSTGKPVYITAIGCPGRHNPDGQDRSQGKLDPARAGRWGEPWSPTLQAKWFDAVTRIALGKPFVESVTWANLSDVNATLPAGGLVDDMFKPKPIFDTFQTLRQTYQRRDAQK